MSSSMYEDDRMMSLVAALAHIGSKSEGIVSYDTLTQEVCRKEQVSHNIFRDWLGEVSALLVDINDKECTDLDA